MNFDKKNFLGKLNSDIDERLFSSERFRSDYSDAYNVLVLSAIDSGIGLVKGFKGTTEVPITYGYTSSTRKIIGRYADLQTRKIYFFVAHSSVPYFKDAIYELDVLSKTVEEVIMGSFLKFNNTMRITGINVVDGKYLLYTDGTNEPRNIDIVRAKAGELTTEQQILAIKQPPLKQPKNLSVANDFTFIGNNIRGNFFQFKYRYVYQDNTKSVFSPISEISEMGTLFFPEVEQYSNNSLNNAISFDYLIPSSDIKYAELAVRVGNTGDFGIFDVINTDVNKSYKKVAVTITSDASSGCSLTFSLGSFTYTATTSESSASLAIDDLYNQFVANGVADLAIVSYNDDLGYFTVSSMNAGDDFSLISSDEDIINTLVLVGMPIISTSTPNTYLFKNNKILSALDVSESNLEYDRIPIKALSQECVNGSNIVYGGITEGYDIPVVDISVGYRYTVPDYRNISVESTTTTPIARLTVPLFPIPNSTNITYDDGVSTSITVPAGTSDINSIYTLFKTANPSLECYIVSSSAIHILKKNNGSLSVTISTSDIENDFISGFGNIVVYSGVSGSTIIDSGTFFNISVTTNGRVLYYQYESVLGDTMATAISSFVNIINNNTDYIRAFVNPTNSTSFKIYQIFGIYKGNIQIVVPTPISELVFSQGLKSGDSFRYAIEYSDNSGRLSTAITTQLCELDIPFIPENGIPNAVITVHSKPPIWATKFQILRTKRKRVGYYLQFNVSTVGVSGNFFELNFNNAVSCLPFYNERYGANLSYQFAQGDRIRFIRYEDGTPFPVHEDLPILSLRTSTDPGALQIPIPKTFSTDTLGLIALKGCIVEVYTPNSFDSVSSELELFYEVGVSGDIGNPGLSNRYHISDNLSGIDQNQTSTLSQPLIVYSTEGDVWYKSRRMLTADPSHIPAGASIFESDFQSDRYPISVSNIGRANAYDKDAKQLFRKSTIYHTDSYQVDSDVNGINRVYATSFKDYTQSFGAINLLYLDGFMLHIFQEKKVGQIPVSRQMVYNQDNSSSLILSSSILNDCRYFDYIGGINNNPESFCYNQFNKYFVDIENNAVCKIGGNGIIRISDIGMTSHFTEVFTKYKKVDTSLTGGQTPRFYGAWDEDNKLVFFAPETITETLPEPDPPIVTSSETIAFSEKQEGWSTKIEFKPTAIIGAFGELISWEPATGKMWTHNTNETRNLFYGSQKTRSIEVPSSINPGSSQSFLSLIQEPAMLSDDRYDSIATGSSADPSIWDVPTITTSLGQASNLLAEDFEKKEGIYFAGFYRDTTTPVTNPLLEGDALKGVWIKLKLTNSSSKDIGLNAIAIGSVPSKRTGV
jgi:hypothetical protein